MRNWTYTHPYAPRVLTMHDCSVTRIEIEPAEEGHRMTWYLPDGIWISPESPFHDIRQVCRTDEACAVFAGKHLTHKCEQAASICMKSRWHGKDKRRNTETWEYMTLHEFISKMQENGWSLEIVNTYTEECTFYVMGEINTPKKRWWRPFRMNFYAETADYFWDAIHPDRVW